MTSQIVPTLFVGPILEAIARSNAIRTTTVFLRIPPAVVVRIAETTFLMFPRKPGPNSTRRASARTPSTMIAMDLGIVMILTVQKARRVRAAAANRNLVRPIVPGRILAPITTSITGN